MTAEVDPRPRDGAGSGAPLSRTFSRPSRARLVSLAFRYPAVSLGRERRRAQPPSTPLGCRPPSPVCHASWAVPARHVVRKPGQACKLSQHVVFFLLSPLGWGIVMRGDGRESPCYVASRQEGERRKAIGRETRLAWTGQSNRGGVGYHVAATRRIMAQGV